MTKALDETRARVVDKKHPKVSGAGWEAKTPLFTIRDQTGNETLTMKPTGTRLKAGKKNTPASTALHPAADKVYKDQPQESENSVARCSGGGEAKTETGEAKLARYLQQNYLQARLAELLLSSFPGVHFDKLGAGWFDSVARHPIVRSSTFWRFFLFYRQPYVHHPRLKAIKNQIFGEAGYSPCGAAGECDDLSCDKCSGKGWYKRFNICDRPCSSCGFSLSDCACTDAQDVLEAKLTDLEEAAPPANCWVL